MLFALNHADLALPPKEAGRTAVSGKNASPLRYQIAQSRSELQESFELTYRAYRRTELVDENSDQIRLTPFHLLRTSEVFITKLEETVVSTVTLFGDGELGLPIEATYPTNVQLMRNRGLRMAEIGSLADRRKSPVRFIDTLATMSLLLAQVARARGYDGIVAATHPKHARLYRRILPFEQIGGQASCSYAKGSPAVMLAMVFDDHRESPLYERFFGSLSSETDTRPRPWSDETNAHFQQVLLRNGLAEERPISSHIASGISPRGPRHRV